MFNDSASRSVFTYSAAPARCEPHRLLSFVTYSAAPARRLSFAYPSLNLRSTFAEGSLALRVKFCFVRAICQSPLPRTTARCPPLFWRGGTGVRIKKKLWQTLKVCQSVWRITPSLWCIALFCDWLLQESTAAFGG